MNQPTNQLIKVGDLVAYRAKFLRSIFAYTGDICFARGEVKSLEKLGQETVLARVEWDKPSLPDKVNVQNLVRVDSPAFSYE